MSTNNFSLKVGRYTLQLRQAATNATGNIAEGMVSISRHFTFRKPSNESEDITPQSVECDDILNSSLAYKGLHTLPTCLIQALGNSVEILDLSHNNISDVSFLKEFRNITTLVLDHNEVTSATVFPKMPKLKILWINHNLIQELYPFLPNLASSCPNLQVLSLLCNRAAPPYMSGSTLTECLNYRSFRTAMQLILNWPQLTKFKLELALWLLCNLKHCRFYIASKLPHLLYLDDGPITSAQRQAAYHVYGEPGLIGYIRFKYSSMVQALTTQPKLNGIV